MRRVQAERLQILADGPKMNTSLIVYDDGEGQSPEDFEKTFLSILHGNKNEIHFVHGKYNMGGAGAVAFCGKKRYQLIGSKRFENSASFGYTLIRRHSLTHDEEKRKKATWYEYLIVDQQIPSFQYSIKGEREPEVDRDVEITEYIADLFKTFYAQFLLNFDTKELVAALDV